MKSFEEFQSFGKDGFEAYVASSNALTKGFQALAAEMMEYSKAAFDDGIRTWGELIGVRSLEQAIQIQSDYAKAAYEGFVSYASKLGELYTDLAKDTVKPYEAIIGKVQAAAK